MNTAATVIGRGSRFAASRMACARSSVGVASGGPEMTISESIAGSDAMSSIARA